MIKKTYKILILIVIFTIIALSCVFLIFKKDYGYDKSTSVAYEAIKTPNSFVEIPTNKTIDGVDYLQSNLPVGRFGGQIVTSILGEPTTFNPYNSQDATSSELSEIMYDGLVQTNPNNGEVIPKLAKLIEIKPDNMTYIVHLRKGVKWSDGIEITSADVDFTYNEVIFKGFGEGSAKDVLLIDNKLPSVKAIDKYTVVFKTPKPFAPFLRNLGASILPEHVFKDVVKKGNQYFLSYQGVGVKPSNIVYSGAFHLKSYVPAQRLIFEKNPNYYLINKENKKLPYLDRWVMLIVGDINNQTLKFESGATDTITIQGSLIDRYRELKKHNDFELYNLGASTNTTFMVFNMNNRKNKNGKYYVNPIKQAWFRDKNFRKAIDWAIDRDDLILNVFSGLASPLHSAEPINSLFLNKEIAKGHKKDINYAKNLLKESGFYYKDNILYDKHNHRVEFELLTNAGNTQREATGVSIKQDLENLGIKVNFKPIEFNSLVNKLISSPDFDCVIVALTSNIFEPNSGANVWKSNGNLHQFNKRLKDDDKSTDKLLPFEKELDEIFTKGALELDFNKRKKIYDRYQQIIHDENPMIYLYAPINISAIRNKVKNIYPTKLGGLIYDMAQIYVEE